MKHIAITPLTILVLVLTACNGSADTASAAGANSSTSITAQELPPSIALSIGTLKLDRTDQAIASDQAADLLPLWQVLNSLSASDSAAPEEIEAILEQIQETMTPEQLTAIDGMRLTREDIIATMQELGLTDGTRGKPKDSSQTGERPSSDVLGGGPGRGPGGQEITPGQARPAESGSMNAGALTPLVEAVIDLLESRVH
jgi:hypothetical protein